MDKKQLEELKSALPSGRVMDSLEDRLCASYDGTRISSLPCALVKPTSSDEVAAVMRFATKHSVPVFPRAAATGLTGGAVPSPDGIALDLSGMNRVIRIDRENLVAELEPGVVVGEFQRQVEKLGLFYPPDPASAEFSTIGGNVAENAGGLRCIKYGVTRDYVLALQVVLPDGETIVTGRETLKSVTGYDLTRMFVGSEGTLGVITRITVRLIPLPKKVETLAAYFGSVDAALDASIGAIFAAELPRALEFMDDSAIDAVMKYKKFPIPTGTKAMLLVEYDGSGRDVAESAAQAAEFLRRSGALEVTLAGNASERAAIWEFRKATSPAFYAASRSKVSEDIAVPKTRLKDIIRELKGISTRYGIPVAAYGHAGDGNLHVNFLVSDPVAFKDKVEKAVEELFRKTIEFGGTLSGEHGIGLTKAKFLPLEIGDREMRIMKQLKVVLDPKGIMNPGKIFP